MPIVDMSRITVVGLKKERDDVLDALTVVGAVDLEDVSGPDSGPDMLPEPGEDGTGRGVHGLEDAQEVLAQLDHAIQVSNRLVPPAKKKMFASFRSVSADTHKETLARADEILKKAERMEEIRLMRSTLRGQLARVQAAYDLLIPWADIPIDLSVDGTGQTRIHLGSLPSGPRLEHFRDDLTETVQPVHIEPLASDAATARIAVIHLRRDDTAVRRLLKEHGFNPAPSYGTATLPADQLKEAASERQKLEQQVSEQDDEATRLAAAYRDDFEILYDHYLNRVSRLQAAFRLHRTRSTFALSGWVPTRLSPDVVRGLQDRFVVAAETRLPMAGEDYPIMLENVPLVRPYEAITEMFATPTVKEMDPNPILAPFFFILFGLMLNDAGYGLLLAAGCAFLVWGVRVSGNMRKMSLLLMQGGIAAILSGLLFGSFFGDLLSVVSRDRAAFPVMWFNPLDDPVRMMIISMLIGVVHVFTGMCAKIYMLVRQGRAADAFFDVGSWFMLLIGLGLLAAGGILGAIGTVLAPAGALLIILFSARTSRNPIKRVVKGLYNLYGITSYLSDILSYTRILALGLAGGVIAMVVNIIGSIAGFGLVGIPLFLVVAAGGHLLNLALSALSAYVHTSRLQYVEFFSKFFEGGGRAWSPMRVQSRYTEIKESPKQTGGA